MTIESWQLWALLSAVFAALTAIFAKIGVENIGSDLATFIRTVVVLLSFLVLPARDRPVHDAGTDLGEDLDISHPLRPRNRSFLALLLPSAQARSRHTCRSHRQIERRACRPVRLRVPGRASVGYWMARHWPYCRRRGDHRHEGLKIHGRRSWSEVTNNEHRIALRNSLEPRAPEMLREPRYILDHGRFDLYFSRFSLIALSVLLCPARDYPQ